jgi:serine/threonine protein kinase
MRRILKGVKYIHSLKIVHRDLKPSNIMITDKNLIKPVLVDFGLALKCDKSNYSKSLGTPGYIAP